MGGARPAPVGWGEQVPCSLRAGAPPRAATVPQLRLWKVPPGTQGRAVPSGWGAGTAEEGGTVTRQVSVLHGGPAEPAAGTDGLCCLRQGPLAALCKLETSCLSWKMEESGVCHRGGGSHGRPEWLEGRQRARDLEPCLFLPGGQRGRRSGPQGPDLQRDVRLRAPQTLLPKTPHP